jgi:hypothetical protein
VPDLVSDFARAMSGSVPFEEALAARLSLFNPSFSKSRTFLKRGPQGTRDILIKHGLTCLLNKGELDSLIKKRIIFCIDFYVAYEDIIQQWSMETLSSCGWSRNNKCCPLSKNISEMDLNSKRRAKLDVVKTPCACSRSFKTWRSIQF